MENQVTDGTDRSDQVIARESHLPISSPDFAKNTAIRSQLFQTILMLFHCDTRLSTVGIQTASVSPWSEFNWRRQLGHKLESTVRYLGIEVDDALETAEQTEI
jgi:hypothetical protein